MQASSAYNIWPARVRERRILEGLLVGASLLRHSSQAEDPEAIVSITPTDYGHVRRLLRSSLISTPDLAFHPLAAAMVARTNVYMAVRYGPDASEQNPFRTDDGYNDSGYTDAVRRPLVTRGEIADLGNVRSKVVRRLIEYLRSRPHGYDEFGRMGIIRRCPEQDQWLGLSVAQLSRFLLPWSVKQVRTHFDRLHKAGLVSASRASRNGPWQYDLPESLSTSSSAFHRLPDLDGLESSSTNVM
jgi:hypothetical protein